MKSQRPSWTEVTGQGTPRLRTQLALAGGEGTPKPPEVWCPEWSLGGPAVTMTAGPLPPPVPPPWGCCRCELPELSRPHKETGAGNGEDHPAAGLAQSRPTGSRVLEPCSASAGGTCRQEFWVKVPQPLSRGETTHTHTHAVPAQQGPGGQAVSGCRLREEAHPWGPPEHKQAWGSHGSRASPGHPPGPGPSWGCSQDANAFSGPGFCFSMCPRRARISGAQSPHSVLTKPRLISGANPTGWDAATRVPRSSPPPASSHHTGSGGARLSPRGSDSLTDANPARDEAMPAAAPAPGPAQAQADLPKHTWWVFIKLPC